MYSSPSANVQGFASGDLDNDAWAVRHFVEKKVPLLVCQSYAKNAGLYGERIGALNVVASHSGDVEGGAQRINSQLLLMQRSEISNPPTFGARIVSASWLCTLAQEHSELTQLPPDRSRSSSTTPSSSPNGSRTFRAWLSALS